MCRQRTNEVSFLYSQFSLIFAPRKKAGGQISPNDVPGIAVAGDKQETKNKTFLYGFASRNRGFAKRG